MAVSPSQVFDRLSDLAMSPEVAAIDPGFGAWFSRNALAIKRMVLARLAATGTGPKGQNEYVMVTRGPGALSPATFTGSAAWRDIGHFLYEEGPSSGNGFARGDVDSQPFKSLYQFPERIAPDDFPRMLAEAHAIMSKIRGERTTGTTAATSTGAGDYPPEPITNAVLAEAWADRQVQGAARDGNAYIRRVKDGWTLTTRGTNDAQRTRRALRERAVPFVEEVKTTGHTYRIPHYTKWAQYDAGWQNLAPRAGAVATRQGWEADRWQAAFRAARAEAVGYSERERDFVATLRALEASGIEKGIARNITDMLFGPTGRHYGFDTLAAPGTGPTFGQIQQVVVDMIGRLDAAYHALPERVGRPNLSGFRRTDPYEEWLKHIATTAAQQRSEAKMRLGLPWSRQLWSRREGLANRLREDASRQALRDSADAARKGEPAFDKWFEPAEQQWAETDKWAHNLATAADFAGVESSLDSVRSRAPNRPRHADRKRLIQQAFGMPPNVTKAQADAIAQGWLDRFVQTLPDALERTWPELVPVQAVLRGQAPPGADVSGAAPPKRTRKTKAEKEAAAVQQVSDARVRAMARSVQQDAQSAHRQAQADVQRLEAFRASAKQLADATLPAEATTLLEVRRDLTAAAARGGREGALAGGLVLAKVLHGALATQPVERGDVWDALERLLRPYVDDFGQDVDDGKNWAAHQKLARPSRRASNPGPWAIAAAQLSDYLDDQGGDDRNQPATIGQIRAVAQFLNSPLMAPYVHAAQQAVARAWHMRASRARAAGREPTEPLSALLTQYGVVPSADLPMFPNRNPRRYR